MIEGPEVDFLRGRPSGPIGNETEADSFLRQQYEAIRSVYKELVKQNPSVLATPVVQGTTQQGQGGTNNRVTDQRSHEVFFTVGGKSVSIYKLFVVSSNGNQTINLSNPPSANTDGIRPGANTMLYFPVEMREIYVIATNATPFTVNGPFIATEATLYLWGFTVPDPLVPDWE